MLLSVTEFLVGVIVGVILAKEKKQVSDAYDALRSKLMQVVLGTGVRPQDAAAGEGRPENSPA